MELRGKVAVVTGGASGIGSALCTRFAEEGARAVVVADLDEDGAQRVAGRAERAGVGSLALRTDVTVEADVVSLVARAEERFGPVDLFCSNAGTALPGGAEAPDDLWQRSWAVHVMAHVYAARALLPGMLARGEGYLLNTASAAGLLTNLGTAPYSVTKHAAVALAEWLSITHGDAGIRVSCLCPQGVRTPMMLGGIGGQERDPTIGGSAVLASGAMLEPEEVAAAVVDGIREERFLILPHPEVAEYWLRRASDHERWLAGMRRLQARLGG
jgi:NAD(P)-dependent dehydrogenase (short-subunit alcohol dehydrogenase family)